MPSAIKCWIKQQVFAHFTSTHNTDSRHMPCNTATFDSNPKYLYAFSQREWSFPHKSSLPSKKWQPLAWATRRSRPRWACRPQRRSGGCRGSTRRARWCRTTLGNHAAKRFVCVLFSLHVWSRISRTARDFARLFCGSDDKITSVMLPRC